MKDYIKQKNFAYIKRIIIFLSFFRIFYIYTSILNIFIYDLNSFYR